MTRRKKAGPRRRVPTRRTGEVDWKLLFNQLFALEIKKEHVLPRRRRDWAEALDRLLRAYTSYAPESFNEAIERIGAAETSEQAYAARVQHFENPIHRRLISELDPRRCVGEELRQLEAVRDFLETIWRNQERPIQPGESFFDSPEGRSAIKAFTLDGGEDRQEVALVLVSGFAGHAIKYYLFEEMVTDLNSFLGRPAERPLVREDGIDIEFESHLDYYGRGTAGESAFDILQPGGSELGNTTGPSSETTELLARWLRTLPERYARKKLVFFGYSRGAPIVLDLVRQNPDLSERVLGFVTFGGVVQGTHVARQAVEQAGEILREVPLGEFIETLRASEPTRLGRMLSPLFSDVDLSWISVPRLRAVFEALGYDIGPFQRQVDRLLGGREVREILDGARELSPLERTRWNLRHLNAETFPEPVFLWNVSAITDVQDFVRPVGLRAEDPAARSLLAPVLTRDGTLDWSHLSLDALFLYLTSIDGFKSAPAGLYDTQVELANTKSPTLDRRPLAESLTPAELEELWADPELRTLFRGRKLRSAEDLARVPRSDLFPPRKLKTIEAVDLGEIRGHHWSPLVQALRPPPELSTEHARWDFPRKAFMRALVQLLAFRNVVVHAEQSRTALARRANRGSCPPAEHRDVVFFRSEGVDSARTELQNLYNLVARAIAYGIVVNSARTGLGTRPGTGRPLWTESLYYQGLRLYSGADAELRRGLLEDRSAWPLPRSLVALIGRFPCELASTYPEVPSDRLAEAQAALGVLVPGLRPFELRRLAPGDYVIADRTLSVGFAPSIREALWRGTRARLAAMYRDAEEASAGAEAKLRAMLGAFTPLCTVFSASFDEDAPEQSATGLTVYMPPYHTLQADDLDDPRSWSMEKGLRSLQLRRPVRLAAAELTHVRYLHEADPDKVHAIKLEVRRDFAEPDAITTVASFGRLFEGPEEELYGFETSDRRDALHVCFRPSFALDNKEAAADRRIKETFNKVFGPFVVDAQVHRLALQPRPRRIAGPDETEEPPLRPRFVLEDSSISFRVNRYVDTAVEHLPLQAAGFTCRETASGPHRFHCWRDFWTWDQLRDEFFYGRRPGTERPSLPTHLRGRLLEQLVGTAAKAMVDRAIESIEEAIDGEIAFVAGESLNRYSRARAVLLDRLHAGLF